MDIWGEKVNEETHGKFTSEHLINTVFSRVVTSLFSLR